MIEEKYKFLLELMSHAALFKLKLNEYRGDINKIPTMGALKLMEGEVKELEDLLRSSGPAGADPEAVMMEIGDIMNFLLVIANKAYEAKKEKKNVK